MEFGGEVVVFVDVHEIQIQHYYNIRSLSMSKSKEEKLVQNLREMVPMRFRLTHPKATQSRSKKTSLINRLTSSMHLHA